MSIKKTLKATPHQKTKRGYLMVLVHVDSKKLIKNLSFILQRIKNL